MSLSLFLRIKSVISVFFGLCLIFLSPVMMPLYGITLDAAGLGMAWWYGTCLMGIGLICWYSSSEARSPLLNGILMSLFICDTTGGVVSLVVQFSGSANALGWSNVVLWFALAAGLGYFRFIETGDA